MKTLLQTFRHRAPCSLATPFLTLVVLASAQTQARVAGLGAPTGGGGRSTAGVYANVATLGQISGPARGGIYRTASGSFVGTLLEPAAEITLDNVTAMATGRLELSANGAGLRATGFGSSGMNTLWLRADGYAPGNPIHTLRLALSALKPGAEGWSLALTAAACCQCGASRCGSEDCCPPPRSEARAGSTDRSSVPPATSPPALALIGQADGSLLLRSFLPEVNDEVLVTFLNDGAFAGRHRTTVSSGLRIRGSGQLIAVDFQADTMMLTFDQPMQLLPAHLGISGERIRWRRLAAPNPHSALAWVGLSGRMLAGDALVLHDVRSRSPAQPQIKEATFSGDGRLRVRTSGEVDAVLSLESSPSLGANALWHPDGTLVMGRGVEVQLESDRAETPARYYRIRAD